MCYIELRENYFWVNGIKFTRTTIAVVGIVLMTPAVIKHTSLSNFLKRTLSLFTVP